MALAIDASSPARVAISAINTRTTASFSAPDNSLLVAVVSKDTAIGASATCTMSNSGTALTWTTQADARDGTTGGGGGTGGFCFIATAPLTVGRSLTVTSTTNDSDDHTLKVYVVTGADLSSPVGQTHVSHTTSNASTTYSAYTSSVNDSLCIYGLTDWSAQGSPTSGDTEDSFNAAGQISGLSAYKNITTTSGTGVVLDWDFPGTTNTDMMVAAIEIKPNLNAYIRSVATAVSDNSTTPSCNKPAGTVEGDFMVAWHFGYSSDAGMTAPSGWSLVDSRNATGNQRMKVWKKMAGAGEPSSYQFAQSVVDESGIIIVTFADGGSVDVVDGLTSTAFDNTVDCPSLTPTISNGLLVCAYNFFTGNSEASTWTPPTSMTERADIQSGGGLFSSYGLSDLTLSSASATGIKTATATKSSAAILGWHGSSVVINPVSVILPTVVATSTATGTSSVVVSIPAGTPDGRLLIVAVQIRGNQTTSAPSGWTQIRVDSQGTTSTDIKQYLFKRVASSEPSSYTWTIS